MRGKSLTLNVPKNATASMLLEAGAEKHKAHSKDIMKQEFNYVLLREDCTEVKTLKESSEPFVLSLERFIESNPESTLSSEENNVLMWVDRPTRLRNTWFGFLAFVIVLLKRLCL